MNIPKLLNEAQQPVLDRLDRIIELLEQAGATYSLTEEGKRAL